MTESRCVPYFDGAAELEGYAAYPTGARRPLVILCHAWRGRDDFICEKVNRIAELDYVGFALDVYGKGILGKSKEENARLKRPFVENRSLLQKRLLKGIEVARSLPIADASRIAVIGFGFGGMCALDIARSGISLKGVVSIYGHFDPPREGIIHPITSKVLILHGYRDPISPMLELSAFQKEMDGDRVDWQAHLYGQACHAFATPSAQDEASGILFDAVSAKRAWQSVEMFLKEILK